VRPVKLRPVKLFAALFAAASLALPDAAGATPVICIDPGHDATGQTGYERIGPGSTTYKLKDGGGTPGEAKVVLQIGFKLRKLLVAEGYSVAMTRTTDEFTYGNRGNIARAQFCNILDAALMIRIHADGSTDPSRHGVSTLYPAWHNGWTGDILPESRDAAAIVQRKVVAATGAASLGLSRRGDITGFNWADVPVVLIESGFMTNPREGRRLRHDWYQWKVARGLTRATRAFVPPS
jgi:N-acetylmuramoyl-L-alanine amidase